jgi:hypothetical protein
VRTRVSTKCGRECGLHFKRGCECVRSVWGLKIGVVGESDCACLCRDISGTVEPSTDVTGVDVSAVVVFGAL